MARRAGREPLQHLTGTHRRSATSSWPSGPGVFVPRPETELLAGWAVERAPSSRRPVVVDLCTGSGAIAASAGATRCRRASVHAVELDPGAHAWAERNLAGTGVDLRLGDMADAFHDLDGTVDVVVCNPPYIPLEAWASVAPEARDHDPATGAVVRATTASTRCACWSGPRRGCSGPVAGSAPSTPTCRASRHPASSPTTGRWREVRDHRDLAGRARYAHRPTGTMTAVALRFDLSDPDGAGGRPRGGRHRRTARRADRAADRHRLRPRCRRLRARRRAAAARRQGTRSRHAAAGPGLR